MKRTTFIIVIFLIVNLVGCQSVSPRAELRIAQTAFIGLVESLTQLQQAGQIAADEQAVISELIHTGQALLQQWTEAILTTDERPNLADQFRLILNQLAEWEARKRGL